MKNKCYKEPKVIRSKSGDWYVEYFFKNPETFVWTEFKSRSGINYIKDPVLKEQAAEDLRLDMLAWLKLGNSPFVQDGFVDHDVDFLETKVVKIKAVADLWTLQKAIAEYRTFINGQGLSADTLRTYEKYLKSFEAWLLDNELLNKKAAAFTEMDTEVYLIESFEDNEWSGTTYNNYKDFMVTLFTRCEKLEKRNKRIRGFSYDFEPDELEAKISRPQRNKAYSPVLFDKMKVELNKQGFANLRDYCEWIYLSFMRPKEIRALKVWDIDHLHRQIRIMGKTGDRLIPISDQLMKLINKRNILESPVNNYVFGYAGNVDARRRSVAYFLEKFTIISERLKLDENYGPYSFKPTGVIRMIKAGFRDEEIMVLTGHKTVTAFEAYKRDLVIDNSHVMKGATIDF